MNSEERYAIRTKQGSPKFSGVSQSLVGAIRGVSPWGADDTNEYFKAEESMVDYASAF